MSDDSMKRLYIEPTARCNLQCSMCFRNSWRDEAIGDMSMETFQRAMDTMPASVETVFFGGMGEPLAHPHILDMVREAKARGKKAAIRMTVDEIEKHIQDGKNYTGKFFIGHSDCPEMCQEVADAIRERLGFDADRIQFGNIGAVISTHCGPSTVACFFYGDERTL